MCVSCLLYYPELNALLIVEEQFSCFFYGVLLGYMLRYCKLNDSLPNKHLFLHSSLYGTSLFSILTMSDGLALFDITL